MRKLILSVSLVALACSYTFASNGAAIFNKCKACHGAKAEKVYLNKVPPLTSVDPADRLAAMKGYKEGSINGGKGKFGFGAIMKGQMASLSQEDIAAVNEYITTLK